MIILALRKQLHGIKASHLFSLSKSFSIQTSPTSGINKELLTALRKKTGFSFTKCNAALKLYNNNVDEAEQWLFEQAEKDGWEKAKKLKTRSTNQGLVGVLAIDNFAAIVEVACETDFVARNELFQQLVATTAESTLDFRKRVILQNQKINSLGDGNIAHLREFLLTHDMQTLKVANTSNTLEEHITGVVGKLGENVKLKRALALATSEENIIGTAAHGNYTSNIANCMMGTYAAAVVLKPLKENIDKGNVLHLAKSICQHVIGMNPIDLHMSDTVNEEEALLTQDYLMNDKTKVGDLLEKSHVECVDFVRYSVNQ